MLRIPTATPNIPAEVLVRNAEDLAYGDRVLYFRGGGKWADVVTVISVALSAADGLPCYANVHYVCDNGALDGVFTAWDHAPFAVLTAGVCDNPHSGMALMCTPAPYRLDANPWPGDSTVCAAHKEQMCAALAAVAKEYR